MKKTCLLLFLGLLAIAGGRAQVTTINGLAVVIEFTDAKLTASDAELNNLLNQAAGYSQWGNLGSVKQFFSQQSNGKISLSIQVVRVSLSHNQDYYNNSGSWDGGQEQVNDVVAAINAKYPAGFTGLTPYPGQNRLWCFLMIKSGRATGAAGGVRDANSVRNNGVNIPIQHVALVGYGPANPSISVICHELGHVLFAWTDYYNILGQGWTNLGHYCMMGSGGNSTTPMPINAALRYKKGWITSVTDLDGEVPSAHTVTANSTTTAFRFVNTFNPREYYLIEALYHDGYYTTIDVDGYTTDEGLAIWYVDEDGGLDKPVDAQYPRIKLVQADGRDEMHDPQKTHLEWRGDREDLFDDAHPAFNTALYPLFRWKDGSESGLSLTNISAPGATMAFRVAGRESTITAMAEPGGDIRPKGLVTVPGGGNLEFRILPSIGYEIDEVLVNGQSVGPVDRYVFQGITGNQTIGATFSPVATVFPDSWNRMDIGTVTPPSKSAYRQGAFRIETKGGDIYYGSDQFHFIYRQITGDMEMIARVAGMNKPQGWSKSGIMVRETLTANSKHLMLVKTVWNGIALQYRNTTGGQSSNVNNGNLVKPNWLKINKTGTIFNSFYSENGANWVLFDSRYLPFAASFYVGLCCTGGTANTANISVFDKIGVTGEMLPVNITAVPDGGGTLDGAGEFLYGSAVTLKATASKGYTFKGWYEDDVLLSNAASYSFTLNWRRFIEAHFQGGTGIDETLTTGSVVVYPNPGTHLATLSLDNSYLGELMVRLLTADGRQALEMSLVKTGSTMSLPLRLEGLAAGMYWVEIRTGKTAIYKKLVVY